MQLGHTMTNIINPLEDSQASRLVRLCGAVCLDRKALLEPSSTGIDFICPSLN